MIRVSALLLALLATPALAGDKPVYSWQATFAAGYVYFQEIKEHPSQAPAISTAQYAMLVKNNRHDFRICRLHYSDDGTTPVGVCEDVVAIEDLPKGTN